MARRRGLRDWFRRSAPGRADLPLPPLEMRQLIGPLDDAEYDNPSGGPIHGDRFPPEAYESVRDIGSGCGRLARQLIQQDPQPLE